MAASGTPTVVVAGQSQSTFTSVMVVTPSSTMTAIVSATGPVTTGGAAQKSVGVMGALVAALAVSLFVEV